MNGVLSSVVSAMTHTPASGPRALVTVPPMNPSAGRRTVWALTAQHNKVVAITATTRIPRLELFMSIP
jgi:hypothetical protein